MKWMIASDLHGSACYCRRMLEAFRREGAQRLLLLGDLLYHGPRNDLPQAYAPRQVIAMLNEAAPSLLCVRGNCDAHVDQMVLQFPILAEYAILCWNGRTIYATHGHTLCEQSPPPLQPGDILLHGHTHVPAAVDHGAFLYLNPGSVSIPKNDSPHSYMILEDHEALWKDLDGTVFLRQAL